MSNEFNKKELISFLSNITIYSENKNQIYSLIIPLVLSKKIFKNSEELKEFFDTVFSLSFAAYVYKTRTILVGKLVRYINDMTIEDAVTLNENLSKFLSDITYISKKEPDKTQNKKGKKSSSIFSEWSNYIASGE